MQNFIFHNPTRLLFGKGMIAQLAQELPADCKLMITFGGGSVKRNGVYDQVTEALKGRDYIEFWGIEPNPTVETLRQAIAQGKEAGVNFLLAVGGGSVIDGTKLIAAGIATDCDAWDIVLRGSADQFIPFGTVLTLPATGSEMNNGAVISRKATKEKLAFYSQNPTFSILDPETTFSLPPYQVACGMADTFVHVMEQYLTKTGESEVMDRFAESILSTLVAIAPKVRENQHDYTQMANYMLSATMGLNHFLSMGVSQDWCTHMIGHELTALHGITHGQTLAIVLPATMTVLKEKKLGKILQYGERVWHITTGTDDERAAAAIAKTEEFFRSLGLHTRLGEAGVGDDTIAEVKRRFDERHAAYGEDHDVTGDVAAAILTAAR